MEKVLGMGNALVDLMTQLQDDSILQRFALPKGSMQLVDNEFSNRMIEAISPLNPKQTSGGSAANTIHGLAKLGIVCGFIGKTGNDSFGDFFYNDIQSNGIHPCIFRSATQTGRAIALVSKDSERTFATYLGAAVELSETDLSPSLFNGYDYFHVEGYLVQNHQLIERAMQLAKQKKMKVSLDLASYNVVSENLGFLQHLVNHYVDIIFANEEEARSFTGLEPEDALRTMAEKCDIVVVKIGKRGSLIRQGDKTEKVGIIGIDALDTTGAGDLYASGFLYGLIKKLPLSACAHAGAILSGKVIEVFGAKIDDERWKQIFPLIENLKCVNQKK